MSLTLGKLNNIRHAHRYLLNGAELEQEKDLGIIIDSELMFEEHIKEKVKKANSLANDYKKEFLFSLSIAVPNLVHHFCKAAL